MFKITRDAIYLFVIFLLILFMSYEFYFFLNHYEYLLSLLKIMHKFKTEKALDIVYKMISWPGVLHP